MDDNNAPLFVGCLPTPKKLCALLMVICVLFISLLAGENCDGKCLASAMRPGTELPQEA